jgi:hypothetical protein
VWTPGSDPSKRPKRIKLPKLKWKNIHLIVTDKILANSAGITPYFVFGILERHPKPERKTIAPV